MQNMIKHFNLSSAHIIHAPKLLYAIGMSSYIVSNSEKKIFFPVAIRLSRNTSVCLEAADFYERRQIELQGKDGVYAPSTYMLPLQ